MIEVDYIPGGTGGADTKALATLCSLSRTTESVGEAAEHLAHHALTTIMPVSYGHWSRCCPMLWGGQGCRRAHPAAQPWL